ncbi:MAG: hypothetical protein SGJ10_07090 [Bacteroidota bacterium]|nr:hypothetical protein [Bacteroidota bacterium]
MKKKNIVILLFAAFLFWTCKHTIADVTSLKDTYYSTTGDTESKNMNGDCTSCHEHQSGSKKITLGGALYKEDRTTAYKDGGVINLYSQPGGQGSLLKTIQVDNEGNFYSNANYKISTPYYVEVVSVAGNKAYMGQALAYGSCGSCHGVNTDKIFVK